MFLLRSPSAETLNLFLDRQGAQPFSYTEVGASRGTPPQGYVVDHRRILLGKGQAAFAAGCAALRSWEMFHLGWVEIYRPLTPIAVGESVAIVVRFWMSWWLNACRIVYVIDENGPVRRFGFAYGTLTDHAERGEERFMIEWLEDDTVWYDLFAFSRPAKWLVRLGYPLARQWQKRFGRDSLAAMQRAVQQSLNLDQSLTKTPGETRKFA